MRSIISHLILPAAALLASCGGPAPEPQPIVRLDTFLQGYQDLDSLQQIAGADSLAPELSAMFHVLGRAEVTPGVLRWWSENDVVKVFQPDVDSVFPTIKPIETQLGYILSRAEKEGLDIPPMRYATVTWGNPRPIVRDSATVLIALNHFLGADYPGYSHWDGFRRYNKTPEALPYQLAMALACTQYPMEENEETSLLDWMLYEGAAVEATMRLVEHPELHLALGFTPEQLEYAERHYKMMWREMAQMRIIYDTDRSVINRFIGSAPNTPLLGGNAPGRIGRYMGYKIVRAYLASHRDTPLTTLLSPTFYANRQTLIDSGF